MTQRITITTKCEGHHTRDPPKASIRNRTTRRPCGTAHSLRGHRRSCPHRPGARVPAKVGDRRSVIPRPTGIRIGRGRILFHAHPEVLPPIGGTGVNPSTNPCTNVVPAVFGCTSWRLRRRTPRSLAFVHTALVQLEHRVAPPSVTARHPSRTSRRVAQTTNSFAASPSCSKIRFVERLERGARVEPVETATRFVNLLRCNAMSAAMVMVCGGARCESGPLGSSRHRGSAYNIRAAVAEYVPSAPCR